VLAPDMINCWKDCSTLRSSLSNSKATTRKVFTHYIHKNAFSQRWKQI
jgi:hypothetical protein